MLNTREDLTPLHIAARCGNINFIKNLDENFKHLALQKNNAGYVPLQLAKNKSTAESLLNLTLSLLSYPDDIFDLYELGLLNNVQSSQTLYGNKLKNFLLSRGYNEQDALYGSLEPSDEDRQYLAQWWIKKIDVSQSNCSFKNKLLMTAIEFCNYFFIQEYINKFKTLYSEKLNWPMIGNHHLITDDALKIQYLIYKNFNIVLKIKPYENSNATILLKPHEDPAILLEGA